MGDRKLTIGRRFGLVRWQAGFAAAALAAVTARNAPAAVASLCAEVKIEIRQELALERQAFDAHMRIRNGLRTLALENLAIDVLFTDTAGNTALATSDPDETNALFFITVDSLTSVSDIGGHGAVAPSSVADIHWLIIPAAGAGGTAPGGKQYNVGARLRYTLAATPQSMNVTPDSIYVRPMPRLSLDYFLPTDVYGDDAFTPAVEPAIPFSLGVRVRNAGYGPAGRLTIDSGQPLIVDNKLGLLAAFQIAGCEVNGRAASQSFLADFGDIQPGAAGVARWTLQCTLSGQFKNFSAEFSHSDTLGGQLTSLIEGVRTHRMVRDVMVDLPGRDAVRDFLARDGETYRLFESDNVDSAVSNRSAQAVLTLAESSGMRRAYSLVLPALSAPFYVSKPVTNSDVLSLVSAVRSDGKRLPAANVWFSKTREHGADPWQHALNLFDVNGGGTYTIAIDDASALNEPPVLAPIGDKITRIGDPLGVGFLVTAADPNGTVPSLATTPLPAGATFGVATNGANAEGTFLWQPQAGQEGIHPIRFTASDGALSDAEQIRIYVGRSGEGTNQAGIPLSLENWAVDATNIVASSTAAWARVQWRSIPGIGYDLFCTDDALAPTGANWRPCASNIVPAGVNGEWTDSALGTGRMWRFYQIGLRGGGPVSNGIWGVVRRDAAADAYSLLGAPLRGDGRLDGELGRALSAVLSGDDGGPTDGVGDELYFLEADGAWRVVYLDRSRVWREADGKASALEVGAGRGWLLRRNAARAARATFSGPVGNDLTRQVTVRPGWNLLSISEGRPLRLADVFAEHTGGAPVGGITEAQADQIIAWDGAGQAHWLMYAQGWGAPYDGQWVDLATFEIPDVWLTPGQGLYYYRQPAGGNMTVDF